MEKVKIEIVPEVHEFLNELVGTLFYKEYFGFEDAAQFYVQKMYDFLEHDFINFPHKISPTALRKFGSNYAFYQANNRTTWYIFVEKSYNRYLITHITNNHIKELNDL